MDLARIKVRVYLLKNYLLSNLWYRPSKRKTTSLIWRIIRNCEWLLNCSSNQCVQKNSRNLILQKCRTCFGSLLIRIWKMLWMINWRVRNKGDAKSERDNILQAFYFILWKGTIFFTRKNFIFLLFFNFFLKYGLFWYYLSYPHCTLHTSTRETKIEGKK